MQEIAALVYRPEQFLDILVMNLAGYHLIDLQAYIGDYYFRYYHLSHLNRAPYYRNRKLEIDFRYAQIAWLPGGKPLRGLTVVSSYRH